MSETLISNTLKKYRKERKLTVEEVSSYLSDRVKPVSPKTIYGWENGVSSPGLEFLMALCEFYGINGVLEAFGVPVSNDEEAKKNEASYYFLTLKEWALVQAYRDFPEYAPAVRKIYDL